MPELRPRRVPRSRGVAILLGAAFLAASCGGGGTKSGAGTSTTSSAGSTSTAATTVPVTAATAPAATAPAATAPTATDPALAAKAAAAGFQAADFPGDFAAQPPDPTAGLHIETVWQDMAHCLGVQDTSPPATLATSPDYQRGIATQAVSTVEYTTPASADAINAALTGPKFQACANSAFVKNTKESAPSGSKPGPPVVTPLAVPPAGQKMFAFRVNVKIDVGNGLIINIFHDYYVISNGGTLIRLWFLNPGGGFPPALEQTLVKAVVTRAG